MSETLEDIAKQLKDTGKKVQLIYAFNGTGKTRLSREFKLLIEPKITEKDQKTSGIKIMYYNAFTEDLFYWDNDLENDNDPKLKIQPNSFTDWLLNYSGDADIIKNFQRYTSDKLMPLFYEKDIVVGGKKSQYKIYPEVTFSFESGSESSGNLKISKGEESNFVWSIFYTLLEKVISVLNERETNEPEPEGRATENTTEPEPDKSETDNSEANKFNNLEYVFIDDPVSSLDENHLIELAVNIATLIKLSKSKLKFIITTHNPLFYNVLYNELGLGKKKGAFMLSKNEDGTFDLDQKYGDSNKSFSYHLFLKQTIHEAIKTDNIQKYHFTLLRNLYEKTANFLGYPKWSELLPGDKKAYYNRIIQFTSHSTLSNEAIAEPTEVEKNIVSFLFKDLTTKFNYWEDVKNE